MQDNKTISLLPLLDISTAESLKSLIQEAAEVANEVTLDAKEVERITTPAIQIIISACLSFEGSGKSLKIIQMNDQFKSVFTSLGLDQYLDKLAM